ncbi:MAG: hypothetical protein ABFD49_11845 [Armatimonadota bacterium]|nr:hypothetical protein [bacterium]
MRKQIVDATNPHVHPVMLQRLVERFGESESPLGEFVRRLQDRGGKLTESGSEESEVVVPWWTFDRGDCDGA